MEATEFEWRVKKDAVGRVDGWVGAWVRGRVGAWEDGLVRGREDMRIIGKEGGWEGWWEVV